jgi:radical SAM superfamily enzyme YgiQ (UPF0313 family)
MSSLGFLSIYSLITRRREFVCERFFYDETVQPLSFEEGRPLQSFPVICGSLSFECDYWIFWEQLRRIGILSPTDKKRDEFLIVAGGVGPWSNPYPLMPIVDVFLTGEGELSFNDFLDTIGERGFFDLSKKERLKEIEKKVRGALVVDALSGPLRNGKSYILEEALEEFPGIVPPRLEYPFPEEFSPPSSPIYTTNTEFSGVKLVEISRGCPYGCRFCLAGSLYRPHRPWEKQRILDAITAPNPWDQESVFPDKCPVGLVSPAVADHPDFADILETLIDEGRKVSFSSLRLTALTPRIASLFAKGSVKGIALAPEAGSERLRNIINKNITDADVLESVKMLAESGLQRLKLYFMIGLPGEKDSDLKGIRDLTLEVLGALKSKKRSPQVQISASYFVPKPHTPFEDVRILDETEMKRKGMILKQLIGPLGGVDLKLDPPAFAIIQALLSKGGPSSFSLVDCMRIVGGKYKAALKFFGYNQYAIDAMKRLKERPWRIINPCVGTNYIESEKDKAERWETSPPCPKELFCGRCQACASLR